jgi:hypothetical protein
MSETTHLKLPYLAAAQAQKHVTVNEGMSALDSLVQCSVLEIFRNDPPAGPADGDRYIVGGSPTGGWFSNAYSLAVWRDGAWSFHDA